MKQLTPPSQEVRLRDVDSDEDEENKRLDYVKRVKPKDEPNTQNLNSGKRVSVKRKVPAENQNPIRETK